MTWTQPLCIECWDEKYPDRKPTVVIGDFPEQCCQCGRITDAGIYIRVAPHTVPYPRMDVEGL